MGWWAGQAERTMIRGGREGTWRGVEKSGGVRVENKEQKNNGNAREEIKYLEPGEKKKKKRRKCREPVLAVSIHLRDKSSSYMICFPALQMKASGPALQSDQPCVSPLLPLAGMIFSATQLNDAHCQALWSKQWHNRLIQLQLR